MWRSQDGFEHVEFDNVPLRWAFASTPEGHEVTQIAIPPGVTRLSVPQQTEQLTSEIVPVSAAAPDARLHHEGAARAPS
jgi:hypothetical protein